MAEHFGASAGLRPRAPPGAGRSAGRVVGCGPARAARRIAGHPSRAYRRGLRHHRQGGDPRGGVRVLAERGRLVYTGVATPERWESTPIYFKEITIAGSNAFGVEDFEGVRQHAIAHYLQLVGRRPHRHHTDAHPPLRARGLVARAEGPGPPGPERRRSRWRSRRTAAERRARAPVRALAEPLVARLGRADPRRDRARSGARRGPSAPSRRATARGRPPSGRSTPRRRRRPRARPTASTGRPVASATAAIQAVTRDPPPLATMRRRLARRPGRASAG